VRDLARGIILAADKGVKGETYILANEEVTFRQFSHLLSQASGQKPVRRFLPIAMANFIAKMAEKRAKKTGEKPLMTTFSVYNLARNNTYDYSKAQRELGYTTRSYEETIRDEVAWLLETGKVVNTQQKSA
jgi:dihydroflavonol-4-reductase